MIKLNDVVVEIKQFPNGESLLNGDQISNALDYVDHNSVHFKYETDADLIHLMLLKRYIDESVHASAESSLNIAYMPYSRMDRKEGNSVFTLKYVADFINALKFDHVYVHESHSDVALALLNNSVAVHDSAVLLGEAMEKIDFDITKDYLFYPDAGAQKRYSKLGNYKELVGFKKRNFETGQIESLQVVGDMEPGRKVIIVDDLCSYGGTFMLSAERLKEIGAGDIYLVITHCEDSIFKGKIPGSDLIKKVYTTDSIISESTDEKVEILVSLGWSESKETAVAA